MQRRLLGRTGIAVSEIAFGGVEIGMPYGLGVQSEADMLSEKAAIQLIHKSIDEGINFFDTARLYGQSEHIFGKSFQGKRDRIIISTKCKHLLTPEGNIPSYRQLTKIIEASLIESLEELQTDYIDVFMLHQASVSILQNTDISEIFIALKAKGIIRATGVSTYTLEESKIAIQAGMWDIIQLPFNLLDQQQKEIFLLAKQKGIGIVVRSVLLKGLLNGSFKSPPAPLEGVAKHIKKYDIFLGSIIPDLPTLAIKFALSFDEVGSVLVGLDKPEYLMQAVNAAITDELKADMKKALQLLSFPEPDFLNLHQWNLSGWLK